MKRFISIIPFVVMMMVLGFTGAVRGDPDCIDPPQDLVAWWPMDETSGTVAADIAEGNDGMHINGPTPVPGMVAGALAFDGVDDYVKVPDNDFLDIGVNDFSIDTWIKTAKKPGVQNILDKRVATQPGNQNVIGYHLFHYYGRLGFQMADASGPSFFCSSDPLTSSCTNYVAPASSTDVADGEWHHVAVTVDRDSRTGGRLYVDGAIVYTFNPTIRDGSLSNTADLLIGRRQIPGPIYWDGLIDELEIFSRALSPAEIYAIFNAGSAGKCKIYVPVDIKPGSCPNPLNVKDRGVLPVAILGTRDFDVTQVDPVSVRLEGVTPLRSAVKDEATPYEPYTGREGAYDCTDEGQDGYPDLTLKFDNKEVVQAIGPVNDGDEVVLTLTGNLQGGTPIVGEDVVLILKKGKK